MPKRQIRRSVLLGEDRKPQADQRVVDEHTAVVCSACGNVLELREKWVHVALKLPAVHVDFCRFCASRINAVAQKTEL